jgi:hypothetical protein
MLLKRIGIVAAVLGGLYGLLTAGLYCAMLRPPESFGAIAAHIPMPAFMVLPFRPLWMSARAGSLAAGDPAPDFELPTVDHNAKVKLSDVYRERPVVLIFGSYT